MILQLSLHSSRVARSAKLWEAPPSQPEDQTMPATYRVMSQPYTSQPGYQIHHIWAKLMLQQLHPCPQTYECSLLKAVDTTIQTIDLEIVFLVRVHWGVTISKWPAGGSTRKEQCEKKLALHKPQVKNLGEDRPSRSCTCVVWLAEH